eukprot:350034-Pyramimonas_sp.AAC.1
MSIRNCVALVPIDAADRSPEAGSHRRRVWIHSRIGNAALFRSARGLLKEIQVYEWVPGCAVSGLA